MRETKAVRRARSNPSGRRYPRFRLDADWFVESEGCSTLGRGLEISVRGAMLPVTCKSPFTPDVTLHVSLPARERMFKARCSAVQRPGSGWVLSFQEVSPEDLQLLGTTLLMEFGEAALPGGAESEADESIELWAE
jgi:hypothetical protein